MVRRQRVTAFSDWLSSLPPDHDFRLEEAGRFFGDLTLDELMAVETELIRRFACLVAKNGNLGIGGSSKLIQEKSANDL